MSSATLSLPFPLPTATSPTCHRSRQLSTITSAAARRPRQKATVKTDSEQRQSSSSSSYSNAGFGASEKKEARWRCVEGCGACCKLEKGPSFPSPEEIFTDPSHVEVSSPFCSFVLSDSFKRKKKKDFTLIARTEFYAAIQWVHPALYKHYKSLIGLDGWCIHYEKITRKCSIYSERPYFCRVEPEIFDSLYGISKKKFNKEACSCCRDTIKAIYGPNSKELHNFNNSIWSTPS
ncbi:uncharacterized protein LOC130960491 isoform X1 [Arachis stenosperma]|uniref:uncharacterized protein LOC130960491 isoform X1 n=1 Tax=Arachis stenosperma TaxID=217475 RepID=UPI0025AC76D6|nr:uncharacterized protein LOC130960491 isoform X1 [Arachis stenosperma]XP_057741888.1 uncharacterized protein LOC130960491 isoform X1 [Arachis stenosperma]XP_057741889.1 uncharacterized protein LOC130960491 isoform X1 [Arachis stenosperma]